MEKNPSLYFDFASTTPVHLEVLEEMMSFFREDFGNASSDHSYGIRAGNAVESARKRIAHLINAKADEIYFTSGSTESINLALKGLFFQHSSTRNHIITVKTEHQAVLDTCNWLESIGAKITFLDVDKDGLIDFNQYAEALKMQPLVVAVMHVNNETGVIQNIEEIARQAQQNSALFFTDATQSFGKLPVDVEKQNIDMLCFSAHKIYGPKGVGGLFIKKGITLTPLIHGGGQQNNIRSGTYNVSGIVGLGKAADLARQNMPSNFHQAEITMRELERKGLDFGLIEINGHHQKRSPFISNFRLLGTDSEDFMITNRNEFSVSNGSACSSEIKDVSHVLRAMKIPNANQSIRVSISAESNVDKLTNAIMNLQK